MKKSRQKMLLFGIVFSVLSVSSLSAQTQAVCTLRITGDFESRCLITTDRPCLVPNPGCNIVRVVGYEGIVAEVVVMDMNGRRIATFANTDLFDVSDMPSGMYIVRVKTEDYNGKGSVNYLKLIRK